MSNSITLSYGDEDGAELMEAALLVMVEAGAQLEIATVQLGEEQIKLGFEHGFDKEVLEKIGCSRILLKSVTETDVTSPLCLALGIENAKETYGESDAAQSFSNDEFAIFEPAEVNYKSMINAAVFMLTKLGQAEPANLIAKALKKSNIDDEMSPEQVAETVIRNFA